MLNWYSGVNNFCKVKGLAQLLHKSCILTLANKHKKSIHWVYIVYGRNISVSTFTKEIQLKSRASILSHRNKFQLKIDFSSLDF
jgi:Type II intron maturase